MAGTSRRLPLSGVASTGLSPADPVAPGDAETPLLATKIIMTTNCQSALSKMTPFPIPQHDVERRDEEHTLV